MLSETGASTYSSSCLVQLNRVIYVLNTVIFACILNKTIGTNNSYQNERRNARSRSVHTFMHPRTLLY